MEPIKRKRITRVGSGAYSVYLPKKWIDSWGAQQQEEREVDLHLVNQSLLIVPVRQEMRFASACPPDPARVRAILLSAYVRGHDEAVLRPSGGEPFGNDAVIAAREFLRHLDERLVATVGRDAIGFRLPADAPPPAHGGAEILAALGSKVREVIGLARECVETYGNDPERALHAVRLLRAIHEEDVARIFHQTLRMVARVELPLVAVSDFQILDLAAAELHGIGERAVRASDIVLRDYGLAPADLAYPPKELLARVGRVRPLPAVARDFAQAYRKALDEAAPLLDAVLAAARARDAGALEDAARTAREAQVRLQERIFETVVERWGEEGARTGGQRIFGAYRIADPVGNILGALARIAEHALKLTAAERPAGTETA